MASAVAAQIATARDLPDLINVEIACVDIPKTLSQELGWDVKRPMAFGIRGLRQSLLTPLDLNPAGINGDTTVFEVPIYIDGEPAGALMGSIIKVSGPGEGVRKDREERMTTAVFVLPDGQISVLGVSYYIESAAILPAGEPVTRAIVGGTGDYIGIKGEVATVRNSDDTYTHTLSFIR